MRGMKHIVGHLGYLYFTMTNTWSIEHIKYEYNYILESVWAGPVVLF